MNFFYRWCARYVKKQQDAMCFQISERKDQLNHARYCMDICTKARDLASRYTGINSPRPTDYTPQEIETLIHFVDLKVSGSRVHWGEVIKDHEKWFTSHSLSIPHKEYQ